MQFAKRKNIRVSTESAYNIAQMGFVRSPANGTMPNGTPVEYWIYPNRKDILLLVISKETSCVVTVLDEWKGVVPISYRLYEAQQPA